MEHTRGDAQFEKLNASLNDPHILATYKKAYDHYHTSLMPRLLGRLLVWCGNTVYGHEPSYCKFRAVEVIARVPYHSWACAAYTFMTMFYSDEDRALRLSETARYARLAQDNETMHVVVISHLAREHEHAGLVRHTIIPVIFAFFYFWSSYLLYMIKPRYSFELNYHFENHAFDQYSRFLELHGEVLKNRPVRSKFLAWYGRQPENQYEFFRSVRNDEIIHRNSSVEGIGKKG